MSTFLLSDFKSTQEDIKRWGNCRDERKGKINHPSA